MRARRLPSRFSNVLCALVVSWMLVPSVPAATKYKVLHAFAGKDGGGPFASLILDAQGNLYSTTWSGGTYGRGTVFELTPSSGGRWTETVLHSFCANSRCRDGGLPVAGLVFDSAGNLYGASNTATFEMEPETGGRSFSVIYDGGSGTGFATDKKGKLYGTLGPGKYHEGAVAELTRGSGGWTYHPLYSFCPKVPCIDGDAPFYGGLVWDAVGNLYGTTELGGKGVGGDWGHRL
jgi:uncharacterized repeat protein (TIGR03803 family)